MSSNLPDNINDYASSLKIDHSEALNAVLLQVNKDLQLTGIDFDLRADDVHLLHAQLNAMIFKLQRLSLELLSNFLYRADVAPDKVPLFLDGSKESVNQASVILVQRVLERVRFRLEYQTKSEGEEE